MRNRRLELLCIAILILLAGRVPAQQLEANLKRLQSRFAAERESAILALVDLDPDDAVLLEAMKSSTPAARLGLSRVLARTGHIGGLARWEAALRKEKERLIREELGVTLLTIACREGRDLGSLKTLLPPGSVRRFLLRELQRLDDAQVSWSDDRELGRLVWTGQAGIRCLGDVVRNEDRPSNQRGLAAIILGRIVNPGDWVGGTDGNPTQGFLQLLESGDESLKAALFYAAAAAGVQAPGFLRWVARYAVDDAMGPSVIEACLYLLYTRSDEALANSGSDVVRCALEYTDGYPESIHYNAAVLLKRVVTPELARKRLELLRESRVFGNYFLFDAVLKGLTGKSEALTQDREALLRWGLQQKMPQIRAAAYLRWVADSGEDAPMSGDRADLLEQLSSSVSRVHSSEEDADCYAQRGGVFSLAALGGEEAESILKGLLTHPNEAVRMASAMAIGDHDLTSLKSDLRARLSGEGEFAVFGAAYALKKMGDAAARPAFVRILRSGNWVLMRPSLVNLRSLDGRSRAPDIPSTQADWRKRATLHEQPLPRSPR